MAIKLSDTRQRADTATRLLAAVTHPPGPASLRPQDAWTHGVQLSAAGQFHAAKVAAFLCEGLRAGEAALTLAAAPHAATLLAACREQGIDSEARAREFDVAILDLNLPVMDGYEVARGLRELDGGQAMRFIAVTGFGTEDDHARSHAAGFADHLVKPIDYDRLLSVLEAPRS